MRGSILVLILLLPLAGCAGGKFHRANVAEKAKTALIGISKKDLFACAGVPARSQQVEDMEFFTYVGGGDGTGGAVGVAGQPAGGAVIVTHRRYCEVTFVLRAGKVEKVNYVGRTGGWATSGEQCAFVVEPCLETK